ncbi:c-Myc-binding protein-like [Rhopalosiphum maidis]|uniref:c-Myc-binding protein-like n=1 Tax=Rhopalosiphum maidis TaxID=43146 RepID=UPI000EFFAB1F|nr:c-Myc-binding protein-like [Rhopalosiphum maidis]
MTRRKDFREYLDRNGVLDKFTEIFMELYECPVMEFPTVEYTRKMMVNPNPDEEKISEIKTKLADAYSFRDFLKTENENLKAIFMANYNNMSAEEEEEKVEEEEEEDK